MVMDTSVLKEPRGVMRMLQWIFAIIAFATCCNFATSMTYKVTCKENKNVTMGEHHASYPFSFGEADEVTLSCPKGTPHTMLPPGDFASDAQFFVFTGVVSFLSTMAILVVYVFFSDMYMGQDKKWPMIDFCFTVVLAIFWLSASAAWANGLLGLKSVFGGDWLYASSDSICYHCDKTCEDSSVESCMITNSGSYGGANVSIILGFLNFFLWSANLWFIYKETPWFAGRAPQQQQMEG